jgi:hypothetical protein
MKKLEATQRAIHIEYKYTSGGIVISLMDITSSIIPIFSQYIVVEYVCIVEYLSMILVLGI